MSNIVFFGTPAFALPTLKALADSPYRPVAVVSAPDKPTGRKHILTPSPVAQEAERLGIPCIKPETLRADAFKAQFEPLGAALCVVVAYGKLIPQQLLDSVEHGWLNIHPSLLPAYRGPAPIQQAILDGVRATGVSVMKLDAQQDHGPVVAQRHWEITPPDASYGECHDALAQIGATLLLESLPAYLDGSLVPQPQDGARATFTKKFTREDGHLDWSQSAVTITNRIRALGANPGTWTSWNGKTLNIFGARITTHASVSQLAGSVAFQNGELIVATGDGDIGLDALQLEGSTKQSARDFCNGHAGIVGGMLV